MICNISHSLLAFHDINIQDKCPGGVLVLVLETKFNLYDNQHVKNKSNTTDTTSGVWTNHRSEAPRLTPGFCYRIRVGSSLALYLVICRKLLVPLSFPMSALWLIDWLIDLYIVLNATFSNISTISWRPVLVVEEAGVPGGNHRP